MLSGEFDINARDELRSTLMRVIEDGGAGISIDFDGVTFLDSEVAGRSAG